MNNLNSGMLSIMLETEAKSGIYEMSKESTWPTKGYKFNAELSKCDNGGELSWDNDKKVVLMSADSINKCYVYFDLNSQTLAEYVMAQYTGVQGENAMYYHDSTLANGASDNSYRYAGPSEEVNNFVCFGSNATVCPTDNLYRIIGVFGENYHGVSGEQLVKLIKYDYANSNLLGEDGDYAGSETPSTSYYKGNLSSRDTYYWNYKSSNTYEWSTGLLNETNLNTNFPKNVGNSWTDKIVTATWKVGGKVAESIQSSVPAVTYKNEIVNPTENTSFNAKIGLMYVSDYYFAAGSSAWQLVGFNSDLTNDYRKVSSNNWMCMGLNEWTISRLLSDSKAFEIHADGSVLGQPVNRTNQGVRPSFFLSSSSMYESGTGTMEDPIRVE